MPFRDDRDALRHRLDDADQARKQAQARAIIAEAELERIRRGDSRTSSSGLWLMWTKILLALQASAWVALTLVCIPVYINLAYEENTFPLLHPIAAGLLMTAIVSAFFSPLGLGSAAAVFGIHTGKRWAWSAGMVVSVLSFMCGCLPVGIVTLIALLQPDVKNQLTAGV